MACMIELVNNNIKTLIITVFHVIKKLEEILNINREIEDKKCPNQNFRHENYV